MTLEMAEWIQLLAALLAWVYSIWRVIDATRSYTDAADQTQALYDAKRRELALHLLMQALSVLGIATLLVAIGGVSVTLTNTAQQIIIVRGLLILITVLLALKAFMDRRVRQSLLQRWIRELEDRRRSHVPIDFPDRRK